MPFRYGTDIINLALAIVFRLVRLIRAAFCEAFVSSDDQLLDLPVLQEMFAR